MPRPEINWTVNIWSILGSVLSGVIAIFAAGVLWAGLNSAVNQQRIDLTNLRSYVDTQLADVRADIRDNTAASRANADRLNKADVAAAQFGQRLEGFETLLREVRDELRAFNSRKP
ncbi:hypothetical protein [Amaricoccus solimangrovi]|uniref:hypothetical protein n=1 Tax=Amaricoccus solimangrovi TaxID=2589815 RepID=UPI0015E345CF|nr:hypothetical protein [Amaricoccus solimangrovi]